MKLEQIENGGHRDEMIAEPERRNGRPVHADGFTSQDHALARQRERLAAIRPILDAAVDEFGLERRTNGFPKQWTHEAVATLMERHFDFLVALPYVNAGAPLVGVCLRCGQPATTQWRQITVGNRGCYSGFCGGKTMPPDDLIVGKIMARGFELVSEIPTNSKTKMKLLHSGHDVVVGREPCGQVFELTWNDLRSNVGCGVCHGLQIAVGYNDLLTTHPALAALLVNEADALSVTSGSDRDLLFRCVEDNCNGTVLRNVHALALKDVWPRCNDHGNHWLVGEHAWYLADEYWRDTMEHALVLHGHSWTPQDPELSQRQNLHTRLEHHRNMARKLGMVVPEFTVIMLESHAAGRALDAAVAAEFAGHPTLTDHLGVPEGQARRKYNGHATETRMGVTAAQVFAFALTKLTDRDLRCIIRVNGTEDEYEPERWAHESFDPWAVQSVPSL